MWRMGLLLYFPRAWGGAAGPVPAPRVYVGYKNIWELTGRHCRALGGGF